MPRKREKKVDKNCLINYEELVDTSTNLKYNNRNNMTVKHPNHSIICGPTSSGKTSFLLNLLLTPNMMVCYKQILFLVPDDSEPLYEFLKQHFKRLEAELQLKTKKKYEIVKFYNSIEDFPSVDELDNYKKTPRVIVIDDMVNKKLPEKITDYFIAGRKKNCSCYFLSQSFYQIPILIRRQCTSSFSVLIPTSSRTSL